MLTAGFLALAAPAAEGEDVDEDVAAIAAAPRGGSVGLSALANGL